MNHEHEDNEEIHPKFDFERTSCADDIDSEKDMDNETLPLEIMRLTKNKEILPHQEVIEMINLGNDDEKKKVKVDIALLE